MEIGGIRMQGVRIAEMPACKMVSSGTCMKTLFVTDLDGTLLRRNATVSNESREIIHSLTNRGMCFSYATARALYTSSVVTKGLRCSAPLITKNGVFINDAKSGEILWENIFSYEEAEDIYQIIRRNQLHPMVHSYQNGKEKYSYDATEMSEGIQWFIDGHKNDERILPLPGDQDILAGKIFYFSCIGSKEELENAYHEVVRKYHCIFSKDTYDEMMWLEIMPERATKADAALQLKRMCGCDYLVAFGDGINDIPIFQVADEGYAVENAVEELKEIATGVIAENEKDGVAMWLQDHYEMYQ